MPQFAPSLDLLPTLGTPTSEPQYGEQANTKMHATPSNLYEIPLLGRPATTPVPLRWKITSVLLVMAIGFGSNWSSGVTSAMKSTIIKGMDIDKKQFSLLEASEDFMVTVLILLSGVVTDRIRRTGMNLDLFLPSRQPTSHQLSVNL